MADAAPRLAGRTRALSRRVRKATAAGCVAAALAATAAPARGDDPPVRVTVAPESAGVGETVELTFEIPRVGLSSSRLQPRFEIENLQVVGGPARQESFELVNGTFTRRLALTWYLSPLEPGIARITGIEAILDDTTYTFPDRTVAVTPEPQRPRTGAGPRDPMQNLRDLFARGPRPGLDPPEVRLVAELDPPRPWPGQQAVYTVSLLVERRRPGEGRLQVETIQPRDLPDFVGFWVEEVSLPDHVPAEIVEREGRTFWKQPVLRRALFPLGAGPKTIDPAELELRVVLLQAGFFGEEPLRPEVLVRETTPLRLEVPALPEPPPGFSGAVGDFRASSGLAPAAARAGETALLTVTLEGSGAIAGLPDPTPRVPGARVLPPQERSESRVADGRLVSARTWAWPIVPQRPGSLSVPSLAWTVFDPRSGEFVTIATEAQTLAVAPAAPPAAPRPPAAAASPARLSAPDLRLTAAAVLGLLLAGAAAWSWHRRRRPDADQQTLFAHLDEAAAAAQPRHAAAVAESAWRAYLGERWGLPAASPAEAWPDLLARRGVAPDLVGEITGLMEDLHYLRHAPKLASTEALQSELWQRSRRLARRMRR